LNNRVKELRLFLGLTQEEFGKKLGVTRSAISYIESGRSNITEHMLFTICLMFDVNKQWLKDGCGDMFISHTIREELAGYMGRLLADDNSKKEKYALLLLKVIVDEWELVEKNFDTILKIWSWISERPETSEMP